MQLIHENNLKGEQNMKSITDFFKFTIGFIVYIVKRNT